MTGPERYPDDPVSGFPSPPRTVEDAEGRAIRLRADDGSEDERDALAAMYEAFDPADRAQGIPPSRPSKLEEWLDRILAEDCLNVFAWDGDDVVGHATLVPENGTASPYELAIFVLQSHQSAGIGTALIESTLGHAADEGISLVWLTVERWNRPAVGLYEKIGFETTDAESFELGMAIRLDPQTESTG